MSPYVPSLKTDGKSQDRILIDAQVELVAQQIAKDSTTNFMVLEQYKNRLFELGYALIAHNLGDNQAWSQSSLSRAIFEVGQKYDYQGAFLGELNYAITRLIQRVPQIKVASGEWPASSEIRYWYYAVTVEALIYAADEFKKSGCGIGGVFEDIKDEYKRRVNTGYEAAQILKSGDCYDTPYYTRLVEVVDESGKLIGHQEVMLKRSEETLNKDVLDAQIVLRTKINA